MVRIIPTGHFSVDGHYNFWTDERDNMKKTYHIKVEDGRIHLLLEVSPIMKLMDERNQYYDILPNGSIIRLDQEDFQPSGQWSFVALVDRYDRQVVKFKDLTPKTLEDLEDLKFKNFKYRLLDLDHGTYRIWGDGIKSVYFYPNPIVKLHSYSV